MVQPINSMNVSQATGVESLMPPDQALAPPPGTGPSPPSPPGGGGILKKKELNYDPNKPVYAMNESLNSPSLPTTNLSTVENPQVGPEASFQTQVLNAYNANSPLVEAARIKAKEAYGGKGLLFSDIAGRAAEGAAMDQAMNIVSPDVQLQQEFLKNQQQFGQQGALNQQQFGIQSNLSDQGYNQQLGLGEQQFGQQTKLNEQMNKYDVATQERMQKFNTDNMALQQKYQKEISNLNFGHDMEAALLSSVQNMIGSGNQMLTSLALSGEATAGEVDKIQKSIQNGLQTFANIWKGSSGSKDSFDFSGIGG